MRVRDHGFTENQTKMRRPRRQHLVAEINITPFTDVILVLLVIFMITTPLISEQSIKVNLPKANSGRSPVPGKSSSVRVTVTSKGLVYLDNRLLTPEELREGIRTRYKNNPEILVMVRADKQVSFKEVVTVLDILTDVGIRRFTIATTAEE